MTALLSMLELIASRLLDAGAHAAALALLVGVIVLVTGRWLSARARHALWLLVAARLCLPPLPLAPYSLDDFLPRTEERASTAQVTVLVRESAGPVLQAGHAGSRPSVAATDAAGAPDPGVTWSSWLVLAWLLGALFFAFRLVAAVAAERQRRLRLEPVHDARVQDLLARCAARAGIRRLPGLLAGDTVSAPALAGVLRSRILLPERLLDPAAGGELRDVLHHELAHQKRGDVALEWVMSVLEVIHWPNLICRWAFNRAREERELACDELAVRWSADGDGSRYAATLLGLVEAVSSSPAPAAAGILGRKKVLERRIRSLTEPRPRTTSRALAVALLALCAVVGLTCSSGGEGREDPVTKVYDLGPLAEDRDYYAPRLGFRKEVESTTPSPGAADASPRKRSVGVAARLREAVPEHLWKDDCRIEAQSGAVVIHAPQVVHDQIDVALKKLLADREILVSIQFQLVAVDEPRFASLPPALEREARMARDGTKLEPRALTSNELEALFEGTGRGSARVESKPSITVFHGQVSHTLVVNQAAHIVDVRKSDRPDGAPEPVIEILNKGFVVQVSATVADDRNSIDIDLSAEWGDAKEPIQSFDVQGIPVAAPELSLRTVQAKLQAPTGAWMLAGGFQGRHWVEPRETMLWLVKAEVPDAK